MGKASQFLALIPSRIEVMRYFFCTLLACASLYALAQNETAVTSLTVVNAVTGESVGELVDGLTLDLAAIGTDQLSVIANTSPATVGSVAFGYDGKPDYQVESLAPYTIAGDGTAQDGAVTFTPWRPSVGEHILTVTPYSESGAGGNAGTALTVRFTVVAGAQAAPETATPETVAPQIAAPQTTAPQTTAPQTATPQTTPQTAEPSSEAAAVVVEQAPESTATTRLRQERFEVMPPSSSPFKGSVLVADYGLDQTILTVLVSGASATDSYTAALYEGTCEGSSVVSLQPIDGRNGLSANAVALSFDELVNGTYSLGIDAATAGRKNDISCTRLGGQ